MNTFVLVSACTMGLLGGIHCVVMCGGVVSVLCAGTPKGVRERPRAQLGYVLAYNAGRLTSYALLGALAGLLGALVARVDALYGAQLGLRILAGALMVGVGLFLCGAFPRFTKLEKLGAPLWRRVEPLARRALPVTSWRGASALGLLWGFMPCGLVYAALGLAIASGSVFDGAAAMLAFGAGTLPALLAMGTVAGYVARLLERRWIKRSAGAAIVVFGVVNLATASVQADLMATSVPTCCAAHRE